MKDSKVGEAVSEEKHIDNRRDDREEGAPGLAGDESFPKVGDAAHPEKLVGNKHRKVAEERPHSLGRMSIKAEQAKTSEKTMMRL